jgi:hypothetical protein
LGGRLRVVTGATRNAIEAERARPSSPNAMNAMKTYLSSLLVVVLAGSGAVHPPASPGLARMILATIRVDGELVLRASTSDDGHPDADAVWGYLLDRLEFEPTEAFAALGLEPTAESVTLGWLSSRENAHAGDPPKLELEVAYGGSDEPFELGLVRSKSGTTWRVAAETVEGRFSQRRISRSEAARLVAPERRK